MAIIDKTKGFITIGMNTHYAAKFSYYCNLKLCVNGSLALLHDPK
jgi:hypothetical protein